MGLGFYPPKGNFQKAPILSSWTDPQRRPLWKLQPWRTNTRLGCSHAFLGLYYPNLENYPCSFIKGSLLDYRKELL